MGGELAMLRRHSALSDLIEFASTVAKTSDPACADTWMLSRRRLLPDYDMLFTLLDAHERVRAKSFRAQHHEEDFVIARAILKVLLAAYCACDPKQVQFSYGPHGKPALAMPHGLSSDFEFNMSHSSDVVLIGLTGRSGIGTDVEEISCGDIRSEAIAENCLNIKELLQLAHVPADERSKTLLRFWTHKEACLKAIGCGLSMPPTDLTVTFTDDEHSIIDRTGTSGQEALFGYDIPRNEDYVGSVVGTTQFGTLRFFRL
jgi:4'-phosphopantetheinyl transferase